MPNLDFVKKLYNGKNCYSDHMSDEELGLIHIPSKIEGIVKSLVENSKIVFLTGNPGDGKTFIIKSIQKFFNCNEVYIETDLNNVQGYDVVIERIKNCYDNHTPAIIAVNEFPFMKMCKQVKELYADLYKEILYSKKATITYEGIDSLKNRIAIINLDDRNLLDPDKDFIADMLDKFIELLKKDDNLSSDLHYNLEALSNKYVKSQVLSIFKLVSSDLNHFAVRDILGALSYVFTSCDKDDVKTRYYDALFSKKNELLRALSAFDPIFLSSPLLDEHLWNGDSSIQQGWVLGIPDRWPGDILFDDDPYGALECFKSVKRRYYFENINGRELNNLQPSEIREIREIFTNFESQKKKIKARIIRAINKLFLPTSDDKRYLHIWTTHRFDLSIEPIIAVSTKSVRADDLDILMPHPADWLQGMEYVPNHIILTPKHAKDNYPALTLDIDFLRTLIAVDNGYPSGLLAPRFEQAAAMFLENLQNCDVAEEDDEGEVIIANRKQGYSTCITIDDGKYGFEEDL